MKRYILSILIFIGLVNVVNTQEKILLNPIIREIDAEKFRKVKVYVSFLDSSGKPIINFDTASIFVTENGNGKIDPSTKIFYNSDEGMVICIAMDASYSMEGAPLENVKKGLLSILKDFRAVDKMGIGYFNDDYFKKCDFTSDKEILRNNINELNVGGNYTVLFKSVMESVKWLKSIATPKRKILLIIGDGDEYSPPPGSSYTLSDVQKEIKKSEITVYSIGSIANAKGYNELFTLDSLARSSKDGKYYKINNVDDIKNIIPMIYDRIKQEFILEYWSEEKTSKDVTLKVGATFSGKNYTKEKVYSTPDKVTENPPDKVFYKRKEFYYIVIGAGVVIIVLIVFIILNINKKKKFKNDSIRIERQRQEEGKRAKEQFDKMQVDMQRLMDDIERTKYASQADKERLAMMQNQLERTAMVVPGASEAMESNKRRMTKILETPIPVMKQQASYQSAFLEIRRGQNTGQKITIPPDGLKIGRSEGNYLIPESVVSRKHCWIHQSGGSYILEDLNTTNGTIVNGKKVTTALLKAGDSIAIGNTELIFKI